MLKREGYWKRFEKTGDVRDYLNYTACTAETFSEDEVEEDGWNNHHERDGAVCHADRGI